MQAQSTATACSGRRSSTPMAAQSAVLLLLLLVIPESVPAAPLVHNRSHGEPYPKEYLLDVDYIRDADNPLDQYEAETDATTTTEPFDCKAGLQKWRYGWSDAKKTFCCKAYNLGCSTEEDITVKATTAAVTTTTEEFDCQAGLAKWRLGWSDAKKDFCCKAHKLGCATKDEDDKAATFVAATTAAVTTTTEEFDCQAGLAKWRLGWSDAKKDFCCKAHKLGCATKDEDDKAATFVAATTAAVTTTSEQFDCQAGLAKWRLGWSADKKAFCCKAHKLGCDQDAVTTTEEFDCQEGLAKWRFGWSADKKTFCCKVHKLGCDSKVKAEEFDCQEGLARWQLGWSDAKMKFCCKSHGLGCKNSKKRRNFATSNCTTIKPPRPAWFATTAPEGTPCLFGLDDRDEESHCIIDDPDTNGPFGWCWTRPDKSEWGACNSRCPLFGQFKQLQRRIHKAEENLNKLRKVLVRAEGSSNMSLVQETANQEKERSIERHHPLALLDARTRSTLHDESNHTPPEKHSLRGLLRSFAETIDAPQNERAIAFLQLETAIGLAMHGEDGHGVVRRLQHNL